MRRILAAGLLALAACASSQEDDKDIISNRTGDWEASLSGMNGSAIRGTSGVQSVAVGAGATITIEGAAANVQHPWHVHTGTCATGGPVVGSMGAYPTLNTSAQGTASANASIAVALRENENYHVNVHRSPTDLTVVSCGNLSND